MADELVTVATFPTSSAAHAARARLDSEGIAAVVTDDVVVETLWHAGSALGGVRLRVMQTDADLAYAILFPNAEAAPQQSEPWICGRCQEEVDADFDVCWSCMSRREEVEIHSNDLPVAELSPSNLTANSLADDLPVTSHATRSDNPYASSAVPVDAKQGAHPDSLFVVEDQVRRALRASIFGLVMCPGLLHLFSLWLLMSISLSGESFTKAATWRFYVALAIDLVVLTLYFTVYLRLM